MRYLSKMSTLIYTLLLLFRHGLTESSEISCVAGETAVGCTAIVTCDFGRNIRDNRQTFMIFKYPTGTYNFNSDLRKDVMSCNWHSDQSLNCYVESPFVAHITSLQSVQSNGVINYTKKTSGTFESQSVVSNSSSIIVEISDVSKEHAGIYECQLVSSAYIPSTKCLLTVSERQADEATAICTKSVQPSKIDETTQTRQQSSSDKPGIQPITVIFIIISVIEAVTLLIFVICFRKRLRRCIKRRRSQWTKKRPTEGGEEENTPMTRINYPANTANKQTYTYIDTANKNFQIGTQEVITFDTKETQILESEKKMFTGDLKPQKGDVVMAPSYEYRMFMGTPHVQLPCEMAKEIGYVNCKPVDHVYTEPTH